MEKRFLAYLLVAGFLLGNIWKFSIIRPEILISPLDLAVLILYLYSLLKINKFKDCLKTKNWSLIFYVIWLFVSLIIGSFGSLPAGRQDWIFGSFLSGFAYFARYSLYLFSFIPLSIIFSKKDFHILISALAIMFPLLGLTQYLWFPDLRPFAIYGWDLHYFRVFGTYLDPGFYGFILFWSLLNLKNIYYWAFTYIIFALTYSRSSFLAFFVAEAFQKIKFPPLTATERRRELMARVRGGLKGVILVGLLVLSTFFLLPRSSDGEGVHLERTVSVAARFTDWQKAITIFKSHPLTGVGFNLLRFQFQNTKDWETSHAIAGIDSSLLFILATSGLIGLILYLNFLFHLWQKVNSHPVLSALFIGLFIHSFFLNSQFYPSIILLFSLTYSAFI